MRIILSRNGSISHAFGAAIREALEEWRMPLEFSRARLDSSDHARLSEHPEMDGWQYGRLPETQNQVCSLRPNNTFPVFATYLIPAASPSPFARRRKSASNPFAGARKPGTWFSSLSGPAWAHADHADASSFWVCLAAPNAPMLPAAPPCALPPPSYLFSCAHRSPFSILFLSGLLAGCSPGVHPCSAT